MTSRYRMLVTGGAGFIGSALCEALLEKGHRVVCLDDFSTGHRANIEPFLIHENFSLLQGDIRRMEDCRKACQEADYVLHQAALGSVPRSLADPLSSHQVNVTGFLHMLIAARDARVKRFVYASSSSVYGDFPVLPKTERTIGRPLSPYAVTKYADELYADVFARNYGMQCIGLRYFNVFGRRQDPDGPYAAVIPRFAKRLIRHLPPEINGDGEYSPDFTYIDDVVQANLLALSAPDRSANTVYNIAGGQRTTLNQLVEWLKGCLSRFESEIARIEGVYRDYRKGDVPHSLADTGKARRQLGYSPAYTVRRGLEQAVEWYWNNLQ